jgi:hypothetical protein
VQTNVQLPDLDFVVSWPVEPDNHAPQKVTEIAVAVAKEFKT